MPGLGQFPVAMWRLAYLVFGPLSLVPRLSSDCQTVRLADLAIGHCLKYLSNCQTVRLIYRSLSELARLCSAIQCSGPWNTATVSQRKSGKRRSRESGQGGKKEGQLGEEAEAGCREELSVSYSGMENTN